MTPIEAKLRDELSSLLRRDAASVRLDEPLFLGGLDLDSRTAVCLLEAVESTWGVDVGAEDLDLACLHSLRTLAAFVQARVPRR